MRKQMPLMLATIVLSILISVVTRACDPKLLVAQTTIANNASDMSGHIVMVADSTTPRTVTNAFTFDRDPSAPFAVTSGSAKVTNLDADKLDGEEGSAFHAATNLTGSIPLARLANGTATTVTTTTTGTQNNWAPGLSGDTSIVWTGVSTLTLTGITGGLDGQQIIIRNNSAASLLALQHQNAGSAAANRFLNVMTAADTILAPGGFAIYNYVGSSTTWNMITYDTGGWIAFNTTWGNAGTANTLGNGTLSSFYTTRGKQVFFYITLTVGTTTTSGSSTWTFAVPIAASTGTSIYAGESHSFDTSTGSRYEGQNIFSSTTVFLPFVDNGTAGGVLQLLSGTVPFTIANGDSFVLSGNYPTS